MAAWSRQPVGTSFTSPTFIDSSANPVWDLSILHPAASDHLTNKLLTPRSLSQGQLLEEPEHTHPLLVCVLVIQACLTLCDPMDCSPSGSSVHGILHSRGSFWPRDRTWSPAWQADSLPNESHQGSPSPHPPFKCKVIGKTCSASQRLCFFTHGRQIIFFLRTRMFTKPSFYMQAPLWRREGEGEEMLKGSKYIPKEMCAR